jgi:SAM-dependent methyltransferase
LEEFIEKNREGWNQQTYEAWTKGKGTPEEFAKQLAQDPWKKLRPYRNYLGELEGKRIANLLGSNGRFAVSLALLGADVTVVDISSENARYGHELARAANVNVQFIVSDVMNIPKENQPMDMDMVIMELGILHWMLDLTSFFQMVSHMLKDGGRLILRDYHPIKRGLLRWDGNQMVASANYFDTSIHEGDVPYAIHLNQEERAKLSKVYTRGWTMGDIVTAIAASGLVIKVLDEEKGSIQRWVFPAEAPDNIEDRIPGIFTIVADKKGVSR